MIHWKRLAGCMMIATLILGAMTGCGTTSSSADATQASESTETTAETEANEFSFQVDCDLETSDTTLVGTVTAVSGSEVTLNIYDTSTMQGMGGPGNGEAPDGEAPSGEKPDGEAPSGEKPDGEAPSGENTEGQAPDGQGGPGMMNFDFDSLTTYEGVLTINDESMITSGNQRSIMEAFMGNGNKMAGDASKMTDLGSSSESSDDETSQEDQSTENVSLSDIEEGDLVLITFDEDGKITKIVVIQDTSFLDQAAVAKEDATEEE